MGILRLVVVAACGTRGDSAVKWETAPVRGDAAGSAAAASRPVPLVARNFLRSSVSSDFGGIGRLADIARPPESQEELVKRIPARLYAGETAKRHKSAARSLLWAQGF